MFTIGLFVYKESNKLENKSFDDVWLDDLIMVRN